jgi:hypothetical protein
MRSPVFIVALAALLPVIAPSNAGATGLKVYR